VERCRNLDHAHTHTLCMRRFEVTRYKHGGNAQDCGYIPNM